MNKELIKTVGVNIVAQIITIIAGFILPPLIISTYGSAQNGMVASIGQFISYLAVVEAGIGAATVAALAKPLYDNDKNRINSILAATQNFYSKAGAIFTAMILILVFVYPHIIVGEGINKLTAGLMVIVLSAGVIWNFFVTGKYGALLVADRKNYVLAIFRISGVIFNTIVSVILIKNGSSLIFMKFIILLLSIANNALILLYVKKRYNFINLKTKFHKNTLEQKWDVMYHRIAGMILDNSPLIILTIFCSLYEVSIYSIYLMIFTAVGLLIDTSSDGMQGFFGRFLAEDNPKKLKKIFRKYETAYFLLIGIGYTCALLLTIPFMKIYTQNMTDANYIQPTLASLFVLAGIMNRLRNPATLIIISAGHFKQTKWRAVVEVIINLSASVFFVLKLGFTGILFGAICSLAYRSIDIIIYSSRNIVRNNLFATFLKIIILGLWYYAGFFILSNYIISDILNYFDFVKNAIISAMFLSIPAGIYLFLQKIKENL